jgi:hypothetical protein
MRRGPEKLNSAFTAPSRARGLRDRIKERDFRLRTLSPVGMSNRRQLSGEAWTLLSVEPDSEM